MFKLSKELSGVIPSQKHFGTHLDNNNNSVEEELEFKNFEHAGEILAELWSKFLVSYYPVVAESSCSPFQLPYINIMKDRFVPPHLPVVFSSTGMEWAKDD